jgi:hypothetical protein
VEEDVVEEGVVEEGVVEEDVVEEGVVEEGVVEEDVVEEGAVLQIRRKGCTTLVKKDVCKVYPRTPKCTPERKRFEVLRAPT